MTYGLQDFQNLAQSQGKGQIENLFEQYKKEMLYLRNFSERTLIGYQEIFNRWQKYVGEMPTEKNLSNCYMERLMDFNTYSKSWWNLVRGINMTRVISLTAGEALIDFPQIIILSFLKLL